MNQDLTATELLHVLISGTENYKIIDLREEPFENVLVLEPQLETSVCPHCGTESSKVKSRRIQRYQASPLNGTSTIIEVEVRQFECSNPDCNHNSFTEPIPFASKSEQLTLEFEREIIDSLSKRGLNATARLMKIRGAEIGHSSLRRLMRRAKET